MTGGSKQDASRIYHVRAGGLVHGAVRRVMGVRVTYRFCRAMILFYDFTKILYGPSCMYSRFGDGP